MCLEIYSKVQRFEILSRWHNVLKKSLLQHSKNNCNYLSLFNSVHIYALVGSTKTLETINYTNFNTPNGQNNIVITTENYMTQSKINSNYIFAGLGIVIVLLIFGILVHLWRKSKTLERKLFQQTSRKNGRTNDLSKENQLMIQSDSTMHSCNTEHFYRPIATEYDEIDEDVEIPTLSDDYEKPKKPRKKNKTLFLAENSTTKRNKQSSNLSENILDLYLSPVFAPDVKSSSSLEEKNSYLEVI